MNGSKKRHTALALAALLTAVPLPDAGAQQASAHRPKIGLVLGGGGARGGAHIGVLEVLEQLHVPFDCIAGTSMGALMSGAYLSGVSPEQMRTRIKATDWSGMFDDTAGRAQISKRNKEYDDRFFSALEFGVSSEGLKFREGAVAGTKIKLFFNSLVGADAGQLMIEDMPLPLTLMATDIGTGERVAMRAGDLTTAMRASMSVPGAVAPVLREGHKLVDGGLVDNVPIQEVKDRCGAEVVIAVNVGSPLTKPEDVTGLVSVVGQMVNLLTEQNVSRSLALLTPKDVYMRPELGDITAGSFDRQLEAAEIGRKTALAAADSLRRYSVSEAEYDQWLAQLRSGKRVPHRIDEVQIAPMRYVNPQTLRAGLSQKEGEPLDTQKLDEDLIRIRSAGDLQTIDYSVVNERDKTILRVTPVEKSLGPDYLRFGMNLYSDFRGDSSFNIRALHRRTWINPLGGEFVVAGQVGTTQALYAEFYQPLEATQTWFARVATNAKSSNAPLFSGGQELAVYRTYSSVAGVEAGANLGTWGQASLGYRAENARASVVTGPSLLPGVRERIGGLQAEVSVDTLDYAFFPTKGVKLDANAFEATNVADDVVKFGTAEMKLNGALSVGDFIFLGALEHGQSTHGVLPLADLYSLGGPRHLAGFAQGQILGDDYSYGSLEAQYKLTRPIPLLGLSLIAGVQAESGKMNKLATEQNLTGWQNSFGAYLAANSAFGPFYFGYAKAKNGGSGRWYFFLGTP
ncbi:MAG TPA: patatin-like phospholipase family protein [Usitatibacter sp.]|nr:patatin-like phospholipase family protein [Usitatibacter sp.]